MRVILIFAIVLLQTLTFGQSDSLRSEIPTYLPDSFHLVYDELTEIIALDSTDSKALIERADLISGLNDPKYFFSIFKNSTVYEQALADYTRAVELRPYSYLPYFKRGLLKDRFLKYKAALEDYEEAYTYAWAKDEKIKVRIHRSRLKAQLGERDVAIRDLEKALLEDRQNKNLLNTLALIHLELEEFSKALKYLNRSLEFHPNDPITFSNIGFVALSSGKYEQAINIYSEQIKKDDSYGYMFSNRGFARFNTGDKEGALEDFNKSIELNPINSFAYKNRAILYFDLEKNEEACADLNKAKSLGYTTQYDDEVIKLLFEKCLPVNQKPKR